jgi:protein-disulfide isomerase
VLTKADGPSKGPANAPVTIVEFGDLECPSCKQAQPVIDKLVADNPNARFIFQQFPLTQIHPWALKASSFADCIARSNPAAFWKFAQSTYDAQANITPENADGKLTELATASGVDGAKTAVCAAAPETKDRVDASTKLGMDAGVTGTPTLFINGRRIGNVTGTPYDFLNKLAKFNADQK